MVKGGDGVVSTDAGLIYVSMALGPIELRISGFAWDVSPQIVRRRHGERC